MKSTLCYFFIAVFAVGSAAGRVFKPAKDAQAVDTEAVNATKAAEKPDGTKPAAAPAVKTAVGKLVSAPSKLELANAPVECSNVECGGDDNNWMTLLPVRWLRHPNDRRVSTTARAGSARARTRRTVSRSVVSIRALSS